MLDIYSGTIGKIEDRSGIESALIRFLIESDALNINGSFSYEFNRGSKASLIILTGKEEVEKEVPIIQHPFLIERDGRIGVIVDIRPFVKTRLDGLMTVYEMVRDRYNAELQLIRGVFIRKILDGELEFYSYLKNNIYYSFATIIGMTLNMITFDKGLQPYSELIAMLHIATTDVKNDRIDPREALSLLPREYLSKSLFDVYRDVASRYEKLKDEFKLPSRTISDFLYNLKTLAGEGRVSNLNAEMLIQSLSRGFYAMDSNSLSIAMMENGPTFMAILINIMNNSINSKSAFRNMLMSNKNKTRPKETAEFLYKVYKEEMVI